jgi:hypothetical protein
LANSLAAADMSWPALCTSSVALSISGSISSLSRAIWGQCYDHYFRRFSPIFGDKSALFLTTKSLSMFFFKPAVF